MSAGRRRLGQTRIVVPSTSRTNDFASEPFVTRIDWRSLARISTPLSDTAGAPPSADPPRTTVGNEPGTSSTVTVRRRVPSQHQIAPRRHHDRRGNANVGPAKLRARATASPRMRRRSLRAIRSVSPSRSALWRSELACRASACRMRWSSSFTALPFEARRGRGGSASRRCRAGSREWRRSPPRCCHARTAGRSRRAGARAARRSRRPSRRRRGRRRRPAVRRDVAVVVAHARAGDASGRR